MITLTPMQEAAVRTVVQRLKGVNTPEPLTYIAGVAGSGKSTILAFILEMLGYPPESVAFCAPTGRAAKVMRMKLKAQKYPNTNATTIHSAIYRAKPAPVATLENDIAAHEEELARVKGELSPDYADNFAKLMEQPEIKKQVNLIERLRKELAAAYQEDKINFQLNPDAPIQLTQLIVVDEASMVNEIMARDLMSFAVPILAIGDPCQLPPVEGKAGLTNGVPDYFLSEIHRQAADNPIIHLSMLARTGEDLPYGDYGSGVVVMDRADYDFTGSFEGRPQFIVGLNKTRWKITQTLRQQFKFVDEAGQKVGPREGEPLIIKKNTREHPSLVNGTLCTAQSSADLIDGNATFRLSFEDDESLRYVDKNVFQGLFEEHFFRKQNAYSAPDHVAYRAKKSAICADWAYCITTHSAQGAEFDDVVLIDESSVFRQDADRHLYTGITRASKKLMVLR